MTAIRGRALEFGQASRTYVDSQTKVASLRSELKLAEEAMKKAEMELSRTKRELLEEAKRT